MGVQTQKCCVCGSILQHGVDEDNAPLCGKKSCVKQFTKIFAGIVQSLDEEMGNETEGILVNDKLVRFNHFDEDFDKVH